MTEVELKGLATFDASNADVFYQLGILYSAGGEIPADYVTAHKWFNLAASRSNADAIRMRRELAQEREDEAVAMDKRAARVGLWSAPDGAGSAAGATISAMPTGRTAAADRRAA